MTEIGIYLRNKLNRINRNIQLSKQYVMYHPLLRRRKDPTRKIPDQIRKAIAHLRFRSRIFTN